MRLPTLLKDLGIFVLLYYGTFALFPYLVTYERYDGTQNVHPQFPIAILQEGKPTIVKWHTYSTAPKNFENQLIQPTSNTQVQLNEIESFELKIDKNGIIKLSLNTDNYGFWSQYSIKNGIVTPISFRFIGAFVVLYGLVIASIGTFLIKRFLAKYQAG